MQKRGTYKRKNGFFCQVNCLICVNSLMIYPFVGTGKEKKFFFGINK